MSSRWPLRSVDFNEAGVRLDASNTCFQSRPIPSNESTPVCPATNQQSIRATHAALPETPLRLSPGRSQQRLPSPQVRHRIRLTLRRKRPIRRPQINQRLHGLQVLHLQQVQRRRRQQEVAEATIQLLLEVEVVEGVDKVRVVQVRVDAEHLAEDGLADAAELLGEPAALAEPVVGRRGCGRGGEGCVERVGDAFGVRGEDSGVVDLAGNPALHEGDVLIGGQLDGLVAAVEPGVGVIPSEKLDEKVNLPADRRSTDGPALILGHVVGLQMLMPWSSFSYITRTKCHRFR